jgi:hypothetical protein
LHQLQRRLDLRPLLVQFRLAIGWGTGTHRQAHGAKFRNQVGMACLIDDIGGNALLSFG